MMYLELPLDIRNVIHQFLSNMSAVTLSWTCTELRCTAKHIKGKYIAHACSEGNSAMIAMMRKYKHKITDDDMVSIGSSGNLPLINSIVKSFPVRGKLTFEGVIGKCDYQTVEYIVSRYGIVLRDYPYQLIQSGNVELLTKHCVPADYDTPSSITRNSYPNLNMIQHVDQTSNIDYILLSDLACKDGNMEIVTWIMGKSLWGIECLIKYVVKYNRLEIFEKIIPAILLAHTYSTILHYTIRCIIGSSQVATQYLTILQKYTIINLHDVNFRKCTDSRLCNYLAKMTIDANDPTLCEQFCKCGDSIAIKTVIDHYGIQPKCLICVMYANLPPKIVRMIMSYYDDQQVCDTSHIIIYALNVNRYDDQLIDELIQFCSRYDEVEISADCASSYSISALKYYISSNPNDIGSLSIYCIQNNFVEGTWYIINTYPESGNMMFKTASGKCTKDIILHLLNMKCEVTPVILSNIARRFPDILGRALTQSGIPQI